MLLGHAVTAPRSAGPVTDADVLLTLHQQGNRQLLSSVAGALQRAHQLLAASAVLTVLRVLEYAAGLAFAGWIGFVSLTGIEVGLLTRQLGYFGLGTAVARITVPMAGDALFIGFLLAISCLALGYWPGGRPAAWDADVAVASWRNAATSSAR
jgi:hypothetical protein